MDVTVTAKIQLIPSDEDAESLIDTSHIYTKACNYVSDYIFRTHNLKQYSINEALYYDLRQLFGLKSQMAQSVIKTVLARYRTIRSNRNKWIKPSFHAYEYDLVWNRDYAFMKDETFSVNSVNGRLHVGFHKNGMEHFFDGTWKFGTAKLVHKHGKLFLHIPMTKEFDALTDTDVNNVVGIDRGIRFLTACYDSNGKTVFCSGAQVKQKRAHYKELRTELQKKQTSSARKRLRLIGQRENRWMRDINHCISKALVESNPKGTLFVLEDLSNVRKATERVRRKDRYVSVSWSYFDLEQKLMYKAQMHGQKMIKVNPAHTSQTCPKCGHVHKGNRDKSRHIFKCLKCGYQTNDDRIGAMNLYRMGIEYLVEAQSSISVL